MGQHPSVCSSLGDFLEVNGRSTRGNVDMLDFGKVIRTFASIRPEFVINCVSAL
jgi:dTDP-4-dehydrorhamnose reductase